MNALERTITDAGDERLASVDGLTVDFDTEHGLVAALKGVSFTIRSNEIVGIVGESGSGKSVACRALLRLLPATARVGGTITLDRQDVLALSEAQMGRLRGRTASMIFQNPASHLDPLMSAGRQIAEALRFHLGDNARAAERKAIGLLRDVRIANPEQRSRAYPHELSGGMKQRVMIASALACQPKLLIADEPTTALDVTVQAAILDVLRDLHRDRDLAIILVSHDLGVIADICHRVVVMKDGEIVEEGRTEEIVTDPRHPYTRSLIESQPEVIAGAQGRASKSRSDSSRTAGERPLLQVENLSVEFRRPAGMLDWLRRDRSHLSLRAVDDVSLAITSGEGIGVVGESGSGKSTLARAIVRLVDPLTGCILFRGEPVTAVKGKAAVEFLRRVQMVYQNPFDSLNPRFTLRDTIAEPLIRHRICAPDEVSGRVDELMDLVKLPHTLAKRRPRQLSGGQCQRVGIARALAMQPEVLIADEVTSALDVTIQAQILELLSELRARMNLTVVLISHDLSVVRVFCDRVAVMRSGSVVEQGSISQVFESPRHEYTRELIAAVPHMPVPLVKSASDTVGH